MSTDAEAPMAIELSIQALKSIVSGLDRSDVHGLANAVVSAGGTLQMGPLEVPALTVAMAKDPDVQEPEFVQPGEGEASSSEDLERPTEHVPEVG